MIGSEATAGWSRTVSSTAKSSSVYMLWWGFGCLRINLVVTGYGKRAEVSNGRMSFGGFQV
jgi:hypothetical protein